MYNLELSFEAPGRKVSDAKALQVGVRQMSYRTEGGALRIWINGRRFVPRGGNWGLSQSMLRGIKAEAAAWVNCGAGGSATCTPAGAGQSR